MRKTIIGFDVGLNGGIAVYKKNKEIKTYRMPVIINKNKKTYDIKKIYKIIKNNKPDIAVIEKVWSIPSDGNVGAFTFGYGFGVISALCESMVKEVVYVSPQKWKKYFNLKRNKKQSVNLCNKIFNTDFKVKDDGQAEALLLIKYYMEVQS